MEIINAKQARELATPNYLNYAMEHINKAANDGLTRCYISCNENRPPVGVITRLVDLGYNIYFAYYNRDDHWFVQADWSDAASGRIFDTSSRVDGYEYTLDEFIHLLEGK